MTKDNLQDFIKSLSLLDKKTLTQKGLKTTEEIGELAKAILPFENAAGTLHRFSDREKILDGVADVYLTAVSIAYQLGFTSEEIETMIHKKALKWSELLSKESKIEFPLPYEIHVTVERPFGIELFKKNCEEIGVKPIVIDLQKNNQTVMLDVMTSSKHYGDNRSAYEEAIRIKEILDNNYKVLRVKIETVPWHPAAPTREDKNPKMPENCYFESHIQIITTESRKPTIVEIANRHKAHVSQNFFKKLENDLYVIMVTHRKYDGTLEDFKNDVSQIETDLGINGFMIKKIETEFAIYDTKISHDFKWLN
jgi:NTP pyrophosphatase (non-canonical NTP hydrolase)